MEKKRILWADSLKGWLMILVIIGHAIQTIMGEGCFNDHTWNFIYSFHMPAFIAISGWFAFKPNRKKNGYIRSCIRRSQQLLVPYFIWSLGRWFLGDLSIERLVQIVLVPDAYFWFLWVLFWICCIFTFCQLVADRLNMNELIPIGASCFFLLGVMVGLEFRYLGFQFLAYYFIFYILGYCIRRFSWLQINNKIALFVFICVWVFLAWFWNMHELPLWMPEISNVPNSLLQYTYRGLTAIIAMLILFGGAPKVLNVDTKFNGWMKDLGVVSLGLYVVHLMILGYIKYFVLNIIPNCTMWVEIGITFVITLVLSIVIVKLFAKNKWTARFLLGKV